MIRLLSIGIEVLSSTVFIIPVIIILQCAFFKQHRLSKLLMVFLFAMYSMAVFSAVGLPTADTMKVHFAFHLIPLIDIINGSAAYMINTSLNILLFMPMGFLLPVIWKEYRSLKKTIFMGAAVSILIELLQIFTFRLTDIDDVITNTFGTLLGYGCTKILQFKLSDNTDNKLTKYEPMILLAACFLIAFFLTPLVSNQLWDIVLSGSL